jgi:hypothetical protein
MSLDTFAQYDIKNIPDSLLKNANAIVRKGVTDIIVKSPAKATLKSVLAVTLINKNADDYNSLTAYYDKLSSISNLKAILFDANGKKIKEFKNNDFSDHSQISSFSIYDDDRVKFLKIFQPTYPYTIEFSYTKEYNSILGYPTWYPQDDFNLAIEYSSYSINYPADLNIRFNEYQTKKIKEENLNNIKTVVYEAKNLKAYEKEVMTAGLGNLCPWVWIGLGKFEFDGYPGDQSDWKSLGSWVYNLSAGLDVLPLNVKTKVHELTDHISNPKEKTKILYEYLQSKSRYVSVQLGIGGFRPFSAEKVASNNYGDCKALSNYMLALLKEVGIKSHLVVVGAGNRPGMNKDFSNMYQANHMILCVPFEKDSVWLECTTQRGPFNYLGSFTGDRNVLLITPEGGKIVKTPAYLPKDNSQIRIINVKIDKDGNAISKSETIYTGEQFEYIQGQLFREAKEQKEFIHNYLDIANPQIIKYNYIQKDKSSPLIEEFLELQLEKVLTSGGNNKFLTLNMLNRRYFSPERADKRITDFKLNMNYSDKDVIVYELPEELKIDFILEDVEINSEFGHYKAFTKVENNKIIYTREQTIFKNHYPANKFNDLVAFYKVIYKADKQKAVLTQIN